MTVKFRVVDLEHNMFRIERTDSENNWFLVMYAHDLEDAKAYIQERKKNILAERKPPNVVFEDEV